MTKEITEKEIDCIHNFVTIKNYINGVRTTKINLDYELKEHEVKTNLKFARNLLKEHHETKLPNIILFSAIHDEVKSLSDVNELHYNDVVDYINEIRNRGFNYNINININDFLSISSALKEHGLYNVSMTLYLKRREMELKNKQTHLVKLVKRLIKKGEMLNKIIGFRND